MQTNNGGVKILRDECLPSTWEVKATPTLAPPRIYQLNVNNVNNKTTHLELLARGISHFWLNICAKPIGEVQQFLVKTVDSIIKMDYHFT